MNLNKTTTRTPRHLYLLPLLLCLISYTAEAQLGIAPSIIGNVKRKSGQRKKVKDVPFTIDTLRYKGDVAYVQRYDKKELAQVMGSSIDKEVRLTIVLTRLLEKLDGYNRYLKRHQQLGGIDNVMDDIKEIKELGMGFDCSNFESEYNLYYKHRNADVLDVSGGASGHYSAGSGKTDEQQQARLEKIKEEIARKDAQRAKEEAAAAEKEQAALVQKDAQLAATYGEADAARAAKGEIWVGMADDLCLRALGKPDEEQRKSISGSNEMRVWYYMTGGTKFTNGYVLVKNKNVIAITY